MTAKEILENIPIPPPKDCGTVLDKWSRLKTYFYFLETAENTESAQQTLDLINTKLIEVEDCHSGQIAEENPGLKYKGRMYPIEEDWIDRRDDGRIIALTAGNKIIIEGNGAFTILTRNEEEILLTKNNGN